MSHPIMYVRTRQLLRDGSVIEIPSSLPINLLIESSEVNSYHFQQYYYIASVSWTDQGELRISLQILQLPYSKQKDKDKISDNQVIEESKYELKFSGERDSQ